MHKNKHCLSYFLQVFHTSVCKVSFTGDWETPSLLKSPELFSMFWPILVILQFRWSRLVFRFPTFPVLLSKPLETVPSVPVTIGITAILIFFSFLVQWGGIIIIIIILLFKSFSHKYLLMVFHCSLSDSKSPQVSRTLFSIVSFERFPLVFLFPILRAPLPVLWWLYRAHRLQLVSPSLS